MNRLYLLSWLVDTVAVPPVSLVRCEYVPLAAPVLRVEAACGLAERNDAACAELCEGIERDDIMRPAVSRAAASGANPVMPRAVIPANSAGTTRRRAAIAMTCISMWAISQIRRMWRLRWNLHGRCRAKNRGNSGGSCAISATAVRAVTAGR